MPANLHDWIFEEFLPQNLKGRNPKTHKKYRHAVQDFAEFLGREPRLDDLSDSKLAALMTYLCGPPRLLAQKTINEHVGRLKTFWNWAAKRRIVHEFPTLGCLPVPERVPMAWRKEELHRLFDACRRQRGWIEDVPAWRWWFTIHAWWWGTGERVTATLLMRVEHLRLDDGWAILPPSIRKGGRKPGVYRLSADLIAMLRAMLPPETKRREIVFPWPLHSSSFYNHYRRLLASAGLPHDRHSGPHRMRVSRASWLKATGGDPTKDLGHASDATTRKHYLDPTLCDDDDGDRLFRPW